MTPEDVDFATFRIAVARDAGLSDGIRLGREQVLNELARVAMTFDLAAADAIWEAIQKVKNP